MFGNSACFLIVAGLLTAGTSAGAHGGGLNSEGCHSNRKTGDYHCHRAPRADQRPPTPALRIAPDTAWSCGKKRYCTEMLSCGEAQFYLQQCGLSRLDGDGDGIPCETLCR